MKDPVQRKSKLYYIDNLRVFLISLVVLHHLAITYGGPGSWYYQESEAGVPEIVPLAMFLATNQAFFMGLFFFISAYFLLPSLRRKGLLTFSRDRLIRLGLPTVLFFFFLNPLTVFIRNRYILGQDVSLLDYVFRSRVFGFGPMWFVEALLLFTFVFLVWKTVRHQTARRRSLPLPGAKAILLFASAIGICQFVIRIWLPVGWAMPVAGFQFPHFLQYIFLFAFGTIAFEQKWLDEITSKMGWRWFISVQTLIWVGFPVLFVVGGAAQGSIDAFMGGLTWQSFSYSIWEQWVGIGLIVGLLGIFKSHFNRRSAFAATLAAGAYGVYVLHPPLLLVVSAVFLPLEIVQIWKFVALAPVVLITCFAFGYLVKKLPLARSIF